jgi:hypothetical protein
LPCEVLVGGRRLPTQTQGRACMVRLAIQIGSAAVDTVCMELLVVQGHSKARPAPRARYDCARGFASARTGPAEAAPTGGTTVTHERSPARAAMITNAGRCTAVREPAAGARAVGRSDAGEAGRHD